MFRLRALARCGLHSAVGILAGSGGRDGRAVPDTGVPDGACEVGVRGVLGTLRASPDNGGAFRTGRPPRAGAGDVLGRPVSIAECGGQTGLVVGELAVAVPGSAR